MRKTAVDVDNRDQSEMLKFYEARFEALSRKVKRIEEEKAFLFRCLLERLVDPDAHLGAIEP